MKLEMRKSCCFCCSLKTGVLIFGIFEIILLTIFLGFEVVDYDNIIQNYTYENGTEYIKDSQIQEPKLWYIFVPFCFIMFVLTSLMIYGSQKDNYKFIMPHFYTRLFFCTVFIINFSYNTVIEFAFYKDFEFGLFILTTEVIFGGYLMYCSYMEFSRVKEIKKSKSAIYPLVL